MSIPVTRCQKLKLFDKKMGVGADCFRSAIFVVKERLYFLKNDQLTGKVTKIL